MAEISEKDVQYIADLAHITLDDAATRRMVHDLGRILEYVAKLDELDTSGADPMMHVLEVTNVFRDDTVGDSLDHDDALENAPRTDGAYFLVPRILDAG